MYTLPLVCVIFCLQVNAYSAETKLLWKAVGLGGLQRKKTELECFMLMDVPVTRTFGGTDCILDMTNAAIDKDQHRRGHGNMTKFVNPAVCLCLTKFNVVV